MACGQSELLMKLLADAHSMRAIIRPWGTLLVIFFTYSKVAIFFLNKDASIFDIVYVSHTYLSFIDCVPFEVIRNHNNETVKIFWRTEENLMSACDT